VSDYSNVVRVGPVGQTVSDYSNIRVGTVCHAVSGYCYIARLGTVGHRVSE
jgi:hypothetical protein